MTFLYSCRHEGDQYRITKMDEHANVESSYLTDGRDCDCPAGVRPKCRHREMFPLFVARKAIGTGECYDYDRGGWVRMFDDPTEVLDPIPASVVAAEGDATVGEPNPTEGGNVLPSAARGFRSRF